MREQSFWLLTAKLVGFAFSFCVPLVVVRYLSQDEVGHYRAAFLVIANAIIVLPLGVSMSAYYFLARESEERRSSCVLNILAFNFVIGGIAALFFFLYPQSIGSIFQSDEITRLAPVIGAVIWIWIFSSFLETVAIANQETRVATVFIITAQFTKALFMCTAAFAFATVEAFLYAAIIQGAIQTLLLAWYLTSRFPGFWRKFDFTFLKEQLVYAVPFGIAGTLWLAQTEIHSWFAGHRFSPADFAVYAYGCFEIPLIAMLAESVTAVLIPRMNVLHGDNDRDEMIRLKARAMQKLSFVYFPAYVFLLITANTFITTLFTQKYAASAGVFVVNITLLPFSILITDPIVRSYKELGRVFLLTRLFIVAALVSCLYFMLDEISMTGMIGLAVGAVVIDKLIAEAMVIRKLHLGVKDLHLLVNVAKTAFASIAAGVATYLVYVNFHSNLFAAAETFLSSSIGIAKASVVHFASGTFVLAVCALVFAPIYLAAANLLGLIEDEEKNTVRRIAGKILPLNDRVGDEARTSAL
ncbi:MAG TPA: oligosaccharide flippase family protein [Pyrinomonadaceae bacterium]|nr:oligosaccharide flippase family protein [Pyrinomonadaceae bacterium]